jgi:membrane protease YdiL (CAAX protease family)
MKQEKNLVNTHRNETPLLKGWSRAVLMLPCWVITSFLFKLILACFVMLPWLSGYLTGAFLGLSEDVFMLAGTLLITTLFLRYFDKLPFKALGFQWKGHRAEMGLGLITGTVLMGLGTLCLLLLHQVEFIKPDFYLSYFICVPFSMIMVAFAEEIVLRGYVLRNLMESCNKYIALVLSSLLFSLLHLSNVAGGDLSWFLLLQIFLAGILIGLPYIYTKNLWFSIALHFSWNFVQGYVFGFNVSGNEFYSLIGQQRVEDNFLNGGTFGFEGSILCTILILAAIVPVFLLFRKKYENRK